MADVVVTVPKGIWEAWIAEGDAAGDRPTGTEWGFYLGGPKPDVRPGDRVYVVSHGRLRGYAPLTRVVRQDGQWVLCRKAGAVAVTIDREIPGFRGFRYRDWDIAEEKSFPDWKTAGVAGARVQSHLFGGDGRPRGSR